MNAFISKITRFKLYLIPFVLLFMGLLTIYGVKGVYSRYAQDDYCYGYRLRASGFWKFQVVSYLEHTEYSSDRFSLTLANSIAESLGGPRFVPFLPSLEILFWLGSLGYIFYQLYSQTKARIIVSGTSALVILFFTLWLAPELYQILFWLSAMQPYLTPIVLTTFILGRFIAIVKAGKLKGYHVLELVILCVIAGGFSETTAIWQLGIWCMILGWSLLLRKKLDFAKKSAQSALVTTLATLVAIVILVICPTNQSRASYYSHPDVLTGIKMSLYYGEEFIRLSIKGTPLPCLVMICFGFLLSKIIATENNKFHLGSYLYFLGMIILTWYALTVVVMLPTEYSMSAYPGGRALLSAHFTLIVCLFLIGWILGLSTTTLEKKPIYKRLEKITLVILGILLFLYTGRTLPRVYDKMDAYKARAQAWDIRQQMILNAKATGGSDIIVPQFESVYRITELKPDPKSWVNVCAARYYGVKSITAIEDYQGISTYPIGK